MYMHELELREWARQRQQELIREAQACSAAQRRARQQLGKALHWLGKQCIVWGQGLQTQRQLTELQGN
jgi:hypothetical protein